MTERTCPQCKNHCPADALKCGRGAEYFGGREGDSSSLTAEERILVLLRRCGHHLHHNAGRDASADRLIGMLTAEEKASLEAILQKCLQHWQSCK